MPRRNSRPSEKMTTKRAARRGAAQHPEKRGSATAARGTLRSALRGRDDDARLHDFLDALRAVERGDFGVRLPTDGTRSVLDQIAGAFNGVVGLNEALTKEIVRVERVVGRDGRLTERASLGEVTGGWAKNLHAVNALIGDLVQPTTEVARVIIAVAEGDLTQKMALDIEGQPLKGEFLRIGTTVNAMVDQLRSFASEVTRVAKEVGTDGKLGGQADVRGVSGVWKDLTDNVNVLANNLTAQVRNIAEVTTAVARGDLSKKITVDARGEVLALKSTVNTMVDQLNSFAAEVTRVAKEVGTEGKLGGQADVRGVSGVWKDLTDNVNFMASNLTTQVRGIVKVVTAVANGDLSQKLLVPSQGEIAALGETLNNMTDTLNVFAQQVTSVAKTVGVEGKLGAQADVPGASGVWKDLTDNVNLLANNLTAQVRNIANVTTAVANGDLSQKITVDVKGEILELKNTINTMVDQLRSFASEVTRVAKEVGTDGKLGGQADVRGVSGVWKDLTDNVNVLAGNLTDQVRNIAKVTTAVADGDLSQKIEVVARGEILQLKDTINTMVDQLRSFASEVTRVAKEVGTDGKLGGQAEVRGVSGVWKDLTDNVNFMASNLTSQVRNIAQVTTAVAGGDLSKKITVDVKGEILELKNTINTMVDQLNSFASEVTRVAREVGVEGKLGGQAEVMGVAGVWKNLTDNVNFMASNLTTQVRGIVKVVTAVANGDLKQKLSLEAKGEVAALAETINSMIDTLGTFADQVTSVAREVGIEGKLGGQAKVPGATGTWRQLTDNVNQLAASLTTQIRAISDVATAVTKGDLTRSIMVGAQGEVALLKDNINQMIVNLRETTRKNSEQDWLKTNLARFSSMMQGQKDINAVAQLIMSELTPLVSAHHGAFFMLDYEGNTPVLKLTSTYGYRERRNVSNRFRRGEGLVGQCALEKKTILLTSVPRDYIQISSGLGEAPPLNIIVLPVLFEGEVKAVIELASFHTFSQIHQIFLDQLTESLGVVLNMISANMRTEELLQQSQGLTQELQSQSRELTIQQSELKRSNSELEKQAAELEVKARQLEEQNTNIEVKNREIEQNRVALEEKAEQLSLISKYKSEFLANMSHELRTPLNSLLILAKLLADNKEGTLSSRQIEYAKTIFSSGADLLTLINEILDLSKVEAGKMHVDPRDVGADEIADFVRRSFQPVADQKSLEFDIHIAADAPDTLHTDPQRLQQVLKNLLSNAFKFTEEGRVSLEIRRPPADTVFERADLRDSKDTIAFVVSDSGIGIPQSKLKLIFEAFQQADGTTSRRYGGTGLGLSISREIARLLGGEIHVTSEPGIGSTFTLFLPTQYVGPEPGDESEDGFGPGDHTRHAPFAPRDSSAAPRAESAPLVAQRANIDEPVPLADDRERIEDGDRVLLVIEDDRPFASILLSAAHEKGFKVLVAGRGDDGLSLASKFHPDAISLDLGLPGLDGWTVLDKLKRSDDTRHIPVQVISAADGGSRAVNVGAFAHLAKPVTREAISSALAQMHAFVDRPIKKLLVVEDDDSQRRWIVDLLGGDDVDITTVATGTEALKVIDEKPLDCVVFDLALPDADGLKLLESIRSQPEHKDLPVIVYTARDLTPHEQRKLQSLAGSIITKSAPQSPEQLIHDTALFLHRVQKQQRAAQPEHPEAAASPAPPPREPETKPAPVDAPQTSLTGKRVLVVDDDVRNIFAITSALEAQGMEIEFAENGRDAIEMLDKRPNFDAILMDLMMPEMDGYQTIESIRRDPRFEKVPIIAVTAKAHTADREKCLQAGASDYLPKPVDIDRLLEMLRERVHA